MKAALSPKERILEVAHRLFYTQGYHQTGINQILDEAGVAKASLYQHYGSKDELGLAYIKKVQENWYKYLYTYLDRKTTPRQKILAAFDWLRANMTESRFNGCRFLNLLAEIDNAGGPMQKAILKHKSQLRGIFKTLAAEHMAQGGKCLIPQVHETLYLLYEAGAASSKVYHDAWPIVAARKTAAALVTDD